MAIPSTHREVRLARDRSTRARSPRELSRAMSLAPLAQPCAARALRTAPPIFRRRTPPRGTPANRFPRSRRSPEPPHAFQHATLAFQSNMCSKPRVALPRAHDGSGRTHRAAPRTRNRGGSGASSSCSCSYSSASLSLAAQRSELDGGGRPPEKRVPEQRSNPAQATPRMTRATRRRTMSGNPSVPDLRSSPALIV